MVNAGLDLDISAGNAVNFKYDGQVGASGQMHALRGTWAGSF